MSPGEIRHAVEHVPGVRGIDDIRARWLGHRLAVELDIDVDGATTVRDADAIMSASKPNSPTTLPALGRAIVRVRPRQNKRASMMQPRDKAHDHDHGTTTPTRTITNTITLILIHMRRGTSTTTHILIRMTTRNTSTRTGIVISSTGSAGVAPDGVVTPPNSCRAGSG